MTISAALQARYSSEVDVDWWEALILSHSLFDSTYYLTTRDETQQGTIDGGTQDFVPVPFKLVMPRRDANGRSDMRIIIGAVGGEVAGALESAIADPTERIRARYTVYLDGDLDPQYDPPITLSLTDIQVNETQIEAIATTADTLNKRFPSSVYRVTDFPGLDRR